MNALQKKGEDEVAELVHAYETVTGFQNELIRALREAAKAQTWEKSWDQGFDDGWEGGCETLRGDILAAVRSAFEQAGFGMHPTLNVALNAINKTPVPDQNESIGCIGVDCPECNAAGKAEDK